MKVKLLPFGVMKESAFREVIDKKDNVFISSIYDDEEEKGILFNLLKAILKTMPSSFSRTNKNL